MPDACHIALYSILSILRTSSDLAFLDLGVFKIGYSKCQRRRFNSSKVIPTHVLSVRIDCSMNGLLAGMDIDADPFSCFAKIMNIMQLISHSYDGFGRGFKPRKPTVLFRRISHLYVQQRLLLSQTGQRSLRSWVANSLQLQLILRCGFLLCEAYACTRECWLFISLVYALTHV